MTDTRKGTSENYEIPNELRDFAEQSVDQARKAFSGFLDATLKAATSLETQAESAQGRFRDVAGEAVSFAEQNMAASFDYAQKLLRAGSVEELLRVQTEFAKSQLETLTRQVQQLGGAAGRSGDTKA